jgi:hypothetical protein
LAQLNIARMQAPLDSPHMAEFVASSDRINLLAEQSPGYVWRLESDEDNAKATRLFGEDHVVNISLWRDLQSLHDFVYRSAHTEVMRRRKEWFDKMSDAYAVLWWVPRGELPTVDDAQARLAMIRERGPTADAFTFKEPQPPPG